MKSLQIILLIFVFFLLAGCKMPEVNSNTAASNQNKANSIPIDNVNNNQKVSARPSTEQAKLDIPKLANKSPKEVQQVLGKPNIVTPITKYSDKMPGEYQDFETPDVKLSIRFYKNKATEFHFEVKDDLQSDTFFRLGDLTGLPLKGRVPVSSSSAQIVWEGNFNGVEFKKITANPSDKGFQILTAETK